MTYILILSGLAALLVGGDLLVRGAVSVASRAGLSPLVIGITLVGFGTSTPELLTSLQAAFAGSPGIALGNVVGSNTANILLILGVAAAISPLAVARRTLVRDGGVAALAALAAAGLALTGEVGRIAGLVLIAGLLVYLWQAVRSGSGDSVETPEVPGMGLPLALGVFAGGLVLTLLGARFLVTGAIDLAEAFGMSQALIGVTIVAVGTSLPELVTSATAALRGRTDIALGNVVGSNIFNILGILGITAAVHPLAVPPEMLTRDLPAMLGATALLLIFGMTGARITRTEGGLLLALYAGYLGWCVLTL